MKLTNNYVYFFLMLVLPLYTSCGSNDDDDGGNGASSFTSTCCQVPHLEVCVGGAKVFVPNAFSPDADGINDLFLPFGDVGVESITSFKIFDGNETVFEQSDFQVNDPSFSWDGVLPDGTIADAVYTYTISIKNVNGLTETFDGSVCARADFNLPCVDFEDHCAYPTQHDGAGGFDPTLATFENCQ